MKFTNKNAPGLSLALDEEFQAADCFSELARGYAQGVVDPYTMMGLQPTGPIRVNLEVIVPSATGLTPEMWKQTATLCPLDWPSNYSLLRLWHTPKSFHQYAAQLKQQVQHQHMFTQWEVNRAKLASRVCRKSAVHRSAVRSNASLNFYRTTRANAYVNHAHQTQAQRVSP